ncbi:MAG: transposase [Verrucomicrobia bacterium]|nr:transposase [Verrucomicrobiota bacterium]
MRDRRDWVGWLFEARKRFGLTVLNYMVTSNHIHLIAVDDDSETTIPDSIQLVAGATAQAYNLRKKRRGAFWEDRYHATAIESGMHLFRCMAYIDMNMCRNGVVQHPSQWQTCGYHEVQEARARYRIIDRERLTDLLGLRSVDELPDAQKRWVEDGQTRAMGHDPAWSESLAVGSESFGQRVQHQLGVRALHRTLDAHMDGFVLRESTQPYGHNSTPKTTGLSTTNTLLWVAKTFIETT